MVCSAREVTLLRNQIKQSCYLVTPGIRPQGSKVNDQIRIVTPADAITAGSDYLVIGRPITQAVYPLQALVHIRDEVDGALAMLARR